MKSLLARAGPVRLVLLIALLALSASGPPASAAAQPAPDPAARVRVDSVEVNLTQTPRFTFAVQIPTLLRFEALEYNGQRLLHVWAYSRVDSLDARIRKATNYLTARPGIFTPLFETPGGTPIMGYVDRAQFSEQLQRALRDHTPESRLSYHRRLS